MEVKRETIPSYSAQTIQILLEAYGVSNGPAEALSEDNLQHFSLYARSPQPITPNLLGQDNVIYFLSHHKKLKDRRVCFLIQTENQSPMALIVQWAGLNLAVAEKLGQYLQKNHLKDFEEVLNASELMPLLKLLYTKVHLLFLGSALTEALIQRLRPAIEKACSGQVRLDFKQIQDVNPSIELFEDCLTMLKEGVTHKVNSIEAFCRHRQHVVQILVKAIEDFKIQNKLIYKDIISRLTIIFKYLQLQQLRLKKQNFTAATPEELTQWLFEDEQAKYAIYQNLSIDLEGSLRLLDMSPLIQMLVLKNKPSQLLQQLQAAQQHHFNVLQNWETSVQTHIKKHEQSWFTFLKEQSLKAATFLYQNSLVKLGVELFPWMGVSLAKRFPKTAEKYLSSGVVIQAFKIVGAGVGVAFIYTAGSYSVVRTLGITTVALEMNQWLQKHCLNDRNASITQPIKFTLSPITSFRVMSAGLSILEMAYWNDIHPVIHVMGGLGGSLALTFVLQQVFPALKQLLNHGTKEERLFMSFLLSSVGHDMGYLIAHYSYAGVLLPRITQYQMRERVMMQLRDFEAQGRLPNLLIRHLSVFNHLKNLIHQENAIVFDWQSRHSFFYHANCKINNNLATDSADFLQCTVTQSPLCLTREV